MLSEMCLWTRKNWLHVGSPSFLDPDPGICEDSSTFRERTFFSNLAHTSEKADQPIFQVDLHCALHRVATSSCRVHVDELATEPFLLLHREHGTGCQRSWHCCDRRTRFVVIWKHFCFILSTGTRIRIDSVMGPRSSSRRHNTSASVTVTVNRSLWKFCYVSLDKKVSTINFRKSFGFGSLVQICRTLDPDRICLGAVVCFPSAFVIEM